MSQVFESSRPRQTSTSMLHPGRQELPLWLKIVHAIDIFAFLPVPRTDPVSTKTSIIGSFLLFGIFLTYFIVTFLTNFVLTNVPRINQTTSVIDKGNYTIPSMAIAFFFGEPFTTYINDPTIFTITMQQITKFKDPTIQDITIQIPLSNCTDQSWVPTSITMLCPPNDTAAIMHGLLYATETYTYPRFSVTYCKKGADCISLDELYKITSGGRLLLYIKNEAPDKDYTDQSTLETTPYTAYQFFLDPGLYLRSEIIMEKTTVTENPIFFPSHKFPSFTKVENEYLSVQNSIFYLSNVTVYNNASALQIWMRLAQDQIQIDIVYVTLIDMISSWGAFWGVLFAGFAFIFLRFNMNRFYQKNPEWDNFDQRIDNIAQNNVNKTDEAYGPTDLI